MTGQTPAPVSDLSGTVVDPSGAPIAGVLVSIKGASINARDTATDDNGGFRFAIPKPGDYEITIQQSPFKPLSQSVNVGSMTAAPLRLVLELAEVSDGDGRCFRGKHQSR